MILDKVRARLNKYAPSKGDILVLVPGSDSLLYIKSFTSFISRRGCPSYIISNNGENRIDWNLFVTGEDRITSKKQKTKTEAGSSYFWECQTKVWHLIEILASGDNR